VRCASSACPRSESRTPARSAYDGSNADSCQQYLQPPASVDIAKSELVCCVPHRIVRIPVGFAQRDLGTACADDDVQCALCHASHRSIGQPPIRISSSCRRTWWPRSSMASSGPARGRPRVTHARGRGSPAESSRLSTRAAAALADGSSSVNPRFTWESRSSYRTWPAGGALACLGSQPRLT